jgi:hypothetical protein
LRVSGSPTRIGGRITMSDEKSNLENLPEKTVEQDEAKDVKGGFDPQPDPPKVLRPDAISVRKIGF